MKICLVCSTGGHLTQMLRLMDAFRGHSIFFITHDSPRTRELAKTYVTYYITQIMENNIKYYLSPPKICWILLRERPDIIISTGSEIAIPIFYIAKLIGIKTIYIETLTRIKEP